jgi:hypothetical protein
MLSGGTAGGSFTKTGQGRLELANGNNFIHRQYNR